MELETVNYDGLVLETSAQIFRLFGGEAMQRDIMALIAHFRRLGTTWFSCHEFEIVIGGLFKAVEDYLRRLPDQDRHRQTVDMWPEVAYTLPPYIKGGPKLLSILSAFIVAEFPSSATPRGLANFVAGQREGALKNLRNIGGEGIETHNQSYCCFWRRGGRRCETPLDPQECRMKWICQECEMRKLFFSCLDILSHTDVSEAKWIKENLEELRSLDCIELLGRLSKIANYIGDSIIFCETPAEWGMLSRDRAFFILQQALRPNRRAFPIRAPRAPVNQSCKVQFSENQKIVEGFLINWSAVGVSILTNYFPERIGMAVVVDSEVIEAPLKGYIVRFHRHNDSCIYGIALKSTKKPAGREDVDQGGRGKAAQSH